VDISEAADIRRTELDLRETQVETRRAEMNAEKMIVRSPMEGLVVLLNIRRQADQDVVRVGDQLHSGYPFMQIVDLRSMVVEAEVNQVDWDQLRIGAKAHLRVDAFPDLELPARVYSIGTLARGSRWRGDYVKGIPVRLKLEKLDPRLIPNFSVSADVVIESEPDVAIIPRECVFRDGAERKPIVFARGSSGWEKREVELGLQNNISVAVHAGVGEGEVIATERPPVVPANPNT
jgi:multidrug resistance efflux pump